MVVFMDIAYNSKRDILRDILRDIFEPLNKKLPLNCLQWNICKPLQKTAPFYWYIQRPLYLN